MTDEERQLLELRAHRRAKWEAEHARSNSKLRGWDEYREKHSLPKSPLMVTPIHPAPKPVAPYILRRLSRQEKARLRAQAQREARDKERVAKYQVMLEMKKNGASMKAIGVHFGISRERVRQIVKKLGTPEEQRLFLVIKYGVARERRAACEECGVLFWNQSKAMKYCSKTCSSAHTKKNRKWKSREEMEAFYRARNRERYKTDLAYRIHKRKQTVDSQRRRAHTDEHKERVRIYTKRHEEFEKFGYTVTPLPPGRRRRDMVSIPFRSSHSSPSEEGKSQTDPELPRTDS